MTKEHYKKINSSQQHNRKGLKNSILLVEKGRRERKTIEDSKKMHEKETQKELEVQKCKLTLNSFLHRR